MTPIAGRRADVIGAVAQVLAPTLVFSLTTVAVVILVATRGSAAHAAAAIALWLGRLAWDRPRLVWALRSAWRWPSLSALGLAPASPPTRELDGVLAAAERSLLLAQRLRTAGHDGVAQGTARGVPGLVRQATRLDGERRQLLLLPGGPSRAAAEHCAAALAAVAASLEAARLRMADACGAEALARAGLDDAERAGCDARLDAEAYARVAEGTAELTRSIR